MNEEQIRKLIKEEMAEIFHSDKYHFARDIQIANGRNIEVGKGIGLKLATESTQKLGFWGATPVTRGTAIPAVTGGTFVDDNARAVIGTISYELTRLGLTS